MKTLLKALSVACSILLSGTALAQQYPDKNITMLVGSPAGGLTDIAGRMYANVVSQSLGQRVVVSNKPGAGGYIAAESLVKSPPDGYTIFLTAGGMHEILSNLMPLRFDPIADFRFVTMLFYTTTFIWARTDLPVNNIKDLIDYAKTSNRKLGWGSTSVGSPGHLVGASLALQTGAPIDIVQYATQGGAGILTDMLAGGLDASFGGYNVFQSALAEKRVKMIAVNADARSPRFPDVPTLAESGFPNSTVFVWWGLAVPAATPEPIVARLHEAFSAAARDPELIRLMEAQDIVPRITSSQEVTKLITDNRARMGKMIQEAGIKLN